MFKEYDKDNKEKTEKIQLKRNAGKNLRSLKIHSEKYEDNRRVIKRKIL